MLTRRTALGTLLGTIAAPAVIRTPGLLMPIKPLTPTHWRRHSYWMFNGAGWDQLTAVEENVATRKHNGVGILGYPVLFCSASAREFVHPIIQRNERLRRYMIQVGDIVADVRREDGSRYSAVYHDDQRTFDKRASFWRPDLLERA